MAKRDVDLEELLDFQKKFIIHAENISELAEELMKINETAADLLRDETSRKSIRQVEELSAYIRSVGIHMANEMKPHEEKTKRELEEFQKL